MEKVKALLALFESSDLSRMKVELEDVSVEFEKYTGQVSAPVVSAPVVSSPIIEEKPKILSPIVGTFYSRPSPDMPSFVQVGDRVSKGQVIAIIEAMKVMNEIVADQDGVVIQILKQDGQAVGYHDPLIELSHD